jgi:lysophospholipid acyltransferase (LPLAT)-like uncharacterized protein
MHNSPLLLRLIAPLMGVVLRLLCGTIRWVVVGVEQDEAVRAGRQPRVVAFWHECVVASALFFRDRQGCAMASQSKDGEIIAAGMERIGFQTVRGSSSKGGRDALRGMIKALKAGHFAGTPVDGPRGPAYEAKNGMIVAAKQAGIPLQPFAMVPSRVLRLKNWDRTYVPLPFSTFVCVYGAPITVPEDASSEDIEAIREEMESAIHAVTERASEILQDVLAGQPVDDCLVQNG